jgi:hypothetical protein
MFITLSKSQQVGGQFHQAGAVIEVPDYIGKAKLEAGDASVSDGPAYDPTEASTPAPHSPQQPPRESNG